MPNEDHGTIWANPRFQERYIAAFNGLTQLLTADRWPTISRSQDWIEQWQEMFNALITPETPQESDD